MSKAERQPSEWHHLRRRMLDPRMARAVGGTLLATIIRALGNRLIKRRDRHYPETIKALAGAISAPPVPVMPTALREPPTVPRRLKLATGYLEIQGWPDWSQPFDDHEQLVSLHRWNWLLRGITDETQPADFDWGGQLMQSWLAAMGPLPPGDASESYTVGERISNATLFVRHTRGRWDALPDPITTALHIMAASLAQRIEYHPGTLSGNHVVNNARGLLFAGHLCGDDGLLRLGRALLQERLPVLIASGRFLREGSSHYQWLFTRWLLELRLLAHEQEDLETLALLEPWIPGLLTGCRFFLVENPEGGQHLPTFGDISPDCEPVWLKDLLRSPLAGADAGECHTSGWGGLFPDASIPAISEECSPSQASWVSAPDAGWYRLEHEGWTAIWRVEDASGPAIASHAHHDLGSLVLYREGREILIDPGRRDYGGEAVGRYGIGAEAHNTLLVDGLPPMLSRGDRFLPARYRRSSCRVEREEHPQGVVVRITHDGPARLGNGVEQHVREFLFTPLAVEIQDRLEGHGEHDLESVFHWPLSAGVETHAERGAVPPDGLFQAQGVTVESSTDGVTTQYRVASADPVGGWRFPAYGEQDKAVSLYLHTRKMLPTTLEYTITIQVEEH